MTRYEDRERPHGQLVIIVKETQDGKIVVRRINFEQPQPNRALHLYAGDRLTVRVPDDDLVIEGGCIVERLRRDTYELIFDEPGTYKLYTLGIEIRTRVRIPFFWDVRGMELCGPGLYTWASKPGEGEEWDRREWIDEIADAGFNYVRVILPSRAWLEGHPQSIFTRLPDGRYDLEQLDEDYLRRLRADLWYARRRGVVIHIDLFDWHILRQHVPDHWHRSEFYGGRNTLEYPQQGKHYQHRWENAVEHPLKADWDYPPGSENDLLQRRYATAILNAFQRIAEITPEGHILGDGNEMEGRSASRAILNRARKFYGVLSYGGTPLGVKPSAGETIEQKCARLARDPQMGWVSYICLHGINEANVQTIFNRIRPLLEACPHLRVLFSTDGTGSGIVRGQGGRPTFEELLLIRDRCREVAGDRYGGFGDIKNLGPEDMRALLEFWKEYGD